MKNYTCLLLMLLFFLLISPLTLRAQEADTLKKYQTRDTTQKAPFYKSKLFKATIVPAILIGYGASTIRDNGIYSSYDARRDILKNHPNFDTWIDDPLLIAPYIELAIANLANVRSNNDLLNTTLVTLKAEAVMAVLVFGLKGITQLERPNGEDLNSMPSGHTAQAFLAASIVHTELRYKSQWYGVGAYGIATSVGLLRMFKNKHWQSDVFIGAGIGILSSHLAYLSHRNRWGRRPFTLIPTYKAGTTGMALFINLDELHHTRQAPLAHPPLRAGQPVNWEKKYGSTRPVVFQPLSYEQE